MKKYVLRDLNDPTKLKIEYRSNPHGTLGEAETDPLTDEDEDPRWLQVETIQDEITGEFRDVVTVDELKKSKTKDEDDRRHKEEKDLEDGEQLKKDTFLDYLVAFDVNNIKDIKDIKEFMVHFIDHMLLDKKHDIEHKNKKEKR